MSVKDRVHQCWYAFRYKLIRPNDDFKVKWLIYGVITIVALGWAASSFGPALFEMVGGE